MSRFHQSIAGALAALHLLSFPSRVSAEPEHVLASQPSGVATNTAQNISAAANRTIQINTKKLPELPQGLETSAFYSEHTRTVSSRDVAFAVGTNLIGMIRRRVIEAEKIGKLNDHPELKSKLHKPEVVKGSELNLPELSLNGLPSKFIVYAVSSEVQDGKRDFYVWKAVIGITSIDVTPSTSIH